VHERAKKPKKTRKSLPTNDLCAAQTKALTASLQCFLLAQRPNSQSPKRLV
jgi:hypothetical protein